MKIRLKLCLGVLALIAGVLAMGRTADAAEYPACAGQQVWDVPGNQGVELYDVTGYDVRNYDLPFSLPAGTYDMVASSFDGYIGRKDVPVDKQERSERWYAEFLDATGNVVGAMDQPTTDLPDDTDVAELLDHYEDIKLTGTAVSVRLILAKDFESLNLVHVGCIGFTRQADPTTTTQGTGTSPSTASTTPATTPSTSPSTVATTPSTTPSTAAPTSTVVVRAQTLPFTGDHTELLIVGGLTTIALGFALMRRSQQLSA